MNFGPNKKGQIKQNKEMENAKPRVCRVCGEAATSACGKCLEVWYCVKSCQVGDWKTHKIICGKDLTKVRDLLLNYKDVRESILEQLDAVSYVRMMESGWRMLWKDAKWAFPDQLERKRDAYISEKYKNWYKPVSWSEYKQLLEAECKQLLDDVDTEYVEDVDADPDEDTMTWMEYVGSRKEKPRPYRAGGIFQLITNDSY